jgi:hypothetical protein
MTAHIDRRLEQLAREIAAKSQPKAPTKGLTGPDIPVTALCDCEQGQCTSLYLSKQVRCRGDA